MTIPDSPKPDVKADAPAVTPEVTDNEVITISKAELKKQIEIERTAAAKPHIDGFSKFQADAQRKESQLKRELDEARRIAEASELSDEDKAELKNVGGLIAKTASIIGHAAGLAQEDVELLATQPTMSKMEALFVRLQANKPVKAPEKTEEPDIMKRLDALGANRQATNGNQGGQSGGKTVRTVTDLNKVDRRGFTPEQQAAHTKELNEAIRLGKIK